MDNLRWLQAWYDEQSGGEWGPKTQWDFASGIKITSVANEGWSVKVALKGSIPHRVHLAEGERGKEGQEGWMKWRLANDFFEGNCSRGLLDELLTTFRERVDPEHLIYVPQPISAL